MGQGMQTARIEILMRRSGYGSDRTVASRSPCGNADADGRARDTFPDLTVAAGDLA